MKKLFINLSLVLFVFSSCTKETITPSDLGQEIMSNDQTAEASLIPWGIGPNKHVWKWNGSSWFEPNPAAGLDMISVNNQSVWGISAGKVFKWNGSSWDLPNANVSFINITAVSPSEAWAIKLQGLGSLSVHRTINGGVTWGWVSSLPLKNISAGDFQNIWGLGFDGKVYTWNGSSFVERPTGSALKLNQIDAMWQEGAWGIDQNNRIWRTIDGYTWTEPNPAARLTNISGFDEYNVWGVSSNGHVWKWNGSSWYEPNPAAILSTVSLGYN